MDIFRKIAERKIEEAIERGELDDLPLRGRPIPEDMAGVPEEFRQLHPGAPQARGPEFRAAYRILKNANVLPEELQLMQEIRQLRARLRQPDLPPERRLELTRQLASRESHHNLLMERRFRRL